MLSLASSPTIHLPLTPFPTEGILKGAKAPLSNFLVTFCLHKK